jgi:Zn-finger nucleic acid-binding protein
MDGRKIINIFSFETGVKLSGSQVRKILKRKKYAYLWAKYSLEDRQNSEKRKEFLEKFQNYLSIAKKHPNLFQIWFWGKVFRGKLPPESFT